MSADNGKGLDNKDPREQVASLTRARASYIVIETAEPERVMRTLAEVAVEQDKMLARWNLVEGLKFVPLRKGNEFIVDVRESEASSSRNRPGNAVPRMTTELVIGGERHSPSEYGWPNEGLNEMREPSAPLQAVMEWAERGPGLILIVEEFNPFVSDPAVQQMMVKAHDAIRRFAKTVIFVESSFKIPARFSRKMNKVVWPLPNQEELEAHIRAAAVAAQRMGYEVNLDDDGVTSLARAMKGMGELEAHLSLKLLVQERQALDADKETVNMLGQLRKKQVETGSDALEVWQVDKSYADVGGLNRLKGIVSKMQGVFGDGAREFGAEPPLGLLLIGPPGTGKTLNSKVIANELGLDLVRLDAGAIFGPLVGQSEQQLRAALDVVDAIAPCVLQIDEVEKGFGSSGGELDGGTSQRVEGTLLTWMQEKAAGKVFIVATANNSNIGAALLRRLGMRVMVDLPGPEARKEIFNIHLKKRGREDLDALNLDIDELVEMTPGYSGAEIEEVVKAAIMSAYADFLQGECEDVEQHHLVDAVGNVTPVAHTMPAEIEAMRRWGEGQALMGSDEPSDWNAREHMQGSRVVRNSRADEGDPFEGTWEMS